MSSEALASWLSARTWIQDSALAIEEESTLTLDGEEVANDCNGFWEQQHDACSAITVYLLEIPTMTGPQCDETVLSWELILESDEPEYTPVNLGLIGNTYYIAMEGITYLQQRYRLGFRVVTDAGYTRTLINTIRTRDVIVSLPSLTDCATPTALSTIRNWLDLIPPTHNSNLGARAWILCERDIEVDENYIVDDLSWNMGAGSSFTVKSGIDFSVQDSRIGPLGPWCNDLWEGIEVEGTANLEVTDTRIENARRALLAQGGTSGSIIASNNSFSHNFYAVFRHQSNTNLQLSGNNFDGTLEIKSLRCDPWYGPSVDDKELGVAAVYVEKGSPVSITEPNSVRNYANGFVLQSANGTIANQFVF